MQSAVEPETSMQAAELTSAVPATSGGDGDEPTCGNGPISSCNTLTSLAGQQAIASGDTDVDVTTVAAIAAETTTSANGTVPKSASVKSPRTGPHKDVQELARQADLLASRGRFAQAVQMVDEALLLEPLRADLHYGRGQCLIQLDRLDEATQAFEEARRLDPQSQFAARGRATAAVRQKRWEEAIQCLEQALKDEPSNHDLRADLARCLTEHGVQRKLAGQPSTQFFHDALQAWEFHAPAYFQLGVEYSEANDHARARDAYVKAVRLSPEHVEAWNNLGVTCRALSEPEAAVEAYTMALKINKNCKKTSENMAICLLEIGCRHLQRKQFKDASAALKQALFFNSQNADIYFNLGVMYAERSKWERARVNYELAVHFDKSHATAFNNLGVVHRRQNNPEAAIACFEQALRVDPKMPLVGKNLGGVYGMLGRMEEAIRLTRLALEKTPNDPETHNNLSLLYRDQCDVDICLEHLDACLRLDPDNHHACSNRLMTLNYQSERSREEVFDAHRLWGERLEKKVSPQFTSWKASGRRDGVLRIGYISPDFYSHSVSFFIHAPLRYHDPTFVHVTCYSDVAVEDEKTRVFQGLVPRWRNILGMSDDAVAQLIHDDEIDILVEITGHTGNNRLACLARKPAPVIVTWIGYPHTTGLTRVDYRISDEQVDPSQAPGLTTERLVYLPECFLCYTPMESPPQVTLKPAQDLYGCATFGCFNNLAKVSSLVIRMWSRLLLEVPGSRLFLKAKALHCPKVQEKFRREFAAHGVDTGRIDLWGLQPHTGSHLLMYNLIDVALDTAPYAGTTTTCEALYMGVPVVTLRGNGIHAQSVGASLLKAVQLEDLVASTEAEYIQTAAALSRDVKRLSALRAGLRTRMLRSPLCDGPRHVARLERLYANIAPNGRAAVAGAGGPAVAAAAVPLGSLATAPATCAVNGCEEIEIEEEAPPEVQ
eukprot:TRINITY_DN5598_c0_g1_i1.p1 TRINITY_DN5598_c0_g1~~TRINITY_DN5598_c0_g1_i1.p1  ORF type:complete len:944 (-),score=128.61 TRINITY_DN5598_c0_g1_i1:118-2949(-)